MAGGTQGGGDDDLITQINVTPLVDVVLVLLIILMVTASYIVSKSIPMDLPKAEGEATAQDRSLVISLDQSGQMYLDAEPIDRARLRTEVRRYREEQENPRAVISADTRVSHGQVVEVIDLLRREQVTRFAINVDPTEIRRAEED